MPVKFTLVHLQVLFRRTLASLAFFFTCPFVGG